MGPEELRNSPWTPPLHRLDALKHIDGRFGIVPGLPEILQPEEIGFRFEVAGEMKEGERCAELAQRVPANSSEDHGRNAGDIEHLLGTGLASGVTGSGVTEFMGNHGGKFRLIVGELQRCGVHVNEAAWQRESSDFLGLDEVEGNRKSHIRITRQVLTEPVDVFGNERIFHQAGLLADFLRELFAQSQLLLQTVEVHAGRNLAAPDGGGIPLRVGRP